VSNQEPRFIKSNTSLANSRNELDVYSEVNNYLDNETRGRVSRAQSVEMLALREGPTEQPSQDENLGIVQNIQLGK